MLYPVSLPPVHMVKYMSIRPAALGHVLSKGGQGQMCATIWVCAVYIWRRDIKSRHCGWSSTPPSYTPPPHPPQDQHDSRWGWEANLPFSLVTVAQCHLYVWTYIYIYISMPMGGSIIYIYIYIGRNQSCQPGRPWKAPRWAKICNKSFKNQDMLGLFYTLFYIIYEKERSLMPPTFIQ